MMDTEYGVVDDTIGIPDDHLMHIKLSIYNI